MGISESLALSKFLDILGNNIGNEDNRRQQEEANIRKTLGDAYINNVFGNNLYSKQPTDNVSHETIGNTQPSETLLDTSQKMNIARDLYSGGKFPSNVRLEPQKESLPVYFANPGTKQIYSQNGQEYTGTIPKNAKIISTGVRYNVNNEDLSRIKKQQDIIKQRRYIANNLVKEKIIRDAMNTEDIFKTGNKQKQEQRLQEISDSLKDYIVPEKDINAYMPMAEKIMLGEDVNFPKQEVPNINNDVNNSSFINKMLAKLRQYSKQIVQLPSYSLGTEEEAKAYTQNNTKRDKAIKILNDAGKPVVEENIQAVMAQLK